MIVALPMKRRSYGFALRVLHAVRGMRVDKNAKPMVTKLVHAANAIGVRIEEANATQRRRLVKLTTASMTARETHYWLQSLRQSGYLEDEITEKLSAECRELIRSLSDHTLQTRRAAYHR
jgi:four helix bundle protein